MSAKKKTEATSAASRNQAVLTVINESKRLTKIVPT